MPTLPVVSTLEQLVVDGTGVGVATSVPMASGPYMNRPQRAGNRLYTVDGKVFDVGNGELVGTFGLQDNTPATAIVVDEAHGRIFEWDGGFLISYDLATLERLAIAQIKLAASWTLEPKLILWGTEGVALADHDQLVVLSGPFFTTYRGRPTM